MKYLNSYKLFESRSAELSEVEFIKILHEKCKEFINSPKLLQRTKDGIINAFSYINPKEHQRSPGGLVAKSSTKHQMLLMDNLPSWSKFPKRSQSVIGCTSADDRSLFGTHRYIVIPFDDARFGVAPTSDIWSCQVSLNDGTEYYFNHAFSSMFGEISDKSYSGMMRELQIKFDGYKSKNIKSKFFQFTPSTYHEDRLGSIFKQAIESGIDDIEEALNTFFKNRSAMQHIPDKMVFKIEIYLIRITVQPLNS